MKLHTELTKYDLYRALAAAVARGQVTPDIDFMKLEQHGSRSHAHRYDFQLGTYDKTSLPAGYRDQNSHKLSTRRYSNSGDSGAANEYGGREGAVWAATWHEWGWIIAAIFDADPTASFGYYQNRADFDARTGWAFAGEDKAVGFPTLVSTRTLASRVK